MPQVTVGDARIAYDVQGDGEPVVLLHGTAQDRTGWGAQVPALVPLHRVVLPEFPGAGQTTDGGGALEIDMLVEQVAAVVDDAGIGRFHLAGYSLGAAVAVATAARLGERVVSLTLLCGWVTTDAHMRFEFRLWRDLLETDVRTFLRHAFSHGFTDTWFDAVGEGAEFAVDAGAALVDGAGAARHAELDARVDLADRVGRVTAPTLVIGATDDRFVGFRHSEELAKAIPGARLEAVDGGHLCILEKADQVTSLLVEHLTQHTGRI